MKRYPVLCLLFFCCVLSCSKEGTTSDSSGTVGTGGSLARFIIVGSHLYIANYDDLRTFDISDPGHPVEKAPIQLDWGVETIFAYGDNLFLGSYTNIYIYSLVNPDKPAKIGQANHLRSCDPVVANDSFAYSTLLGGSRCGDGTQGLYTYSLHNITNPELLSLLPLSNPSGVGVNGKIVYVCRGTDGLSIVDVTDPKKPVVKTTITEADYKDVIVYDKLLICYVSTGILLYDISAAGNPVHISTVAN